jgi:hypothetical protein
MNSYSASSVYLYRLPRLTYFRIDGCSPEVFFFHRLDGAYSLCVTLDNQTVHFSASAPAIEVSPQEVYQAVMNLDQ